MSAHRSAWIHCDSCLDSDHGDQGSRTVGEARAECKQAGWHRSADGGDICPDCWDAGFRRAIPAAAPTGGEE